MSVDSSTVAAYLNTTYEDRLANQINRAVVLAKLLPKKTMRGRNVAWIARLGTSTGAATTDGNTSLSFNADNKVAATLDYATYYDAFGITGRAMSLAKNATGPEELADLLLEHMDESLERIATKVNTEMYAGTGGSSPETIAGLNLAIASSGTYAGIDTGTYSQWKGNVLANSGVGRDLSIQLMRDMIRTIYTASGLKPDLIVCDPIQHEKYGLLMGQFRRFTQEVRLRGEKIELDGGYQALEFDGVPVIEDKDATAGAMYFLNTNHVFIRPLPDAVMGETSNPMAREENVRGTDEFQYDDGPVGIRARVQPLAVNGDLFNYQLLSYLQLQVRRPNACGILKDLNS